MRIQVTIPGEPNEETLGIALEAATRLAQHDLAHGDIPPIEDAIKGGIRWQEEPPGQESFDKPSTVLMRGWGDCDDLAPWLAAEMRETDFDPGASAIAVRSGPQRWHAIVRGSEGDIYDPSVWAGMSMNGIGGRCACTKPLNGSKPALAIGRRGVRVDVPGLQATRGCVVGVSHQCDCDQNDEAKVLALVRTIEDAIATAMLARTGDKRAVKQLAVIYRVLRGDDLSTACNGVGLSEHNVGLDFTSATVRQWIQKAREILAAAADEAFHGETYTTTDDGIVHARKVPISGTSAFWGRGRVGGAVSARAHRMGFVPCLAPIAPLAAAAATAGTIAAVLGPLALALEKMVGEDTDFGRAMHALSDVTSKVKLVSSVGAGITGLIEGGIPEAFQDGTSRWVELLQSPLAAAGASPQSVQEVAKTLHWVERAAASVVPPGIATQLSPKVLDYIGQVGQCLGKDCGKDLLKKAFDVAKTDTLGWLKANKDIPGFLPPSFVNDAGKIEKLAEEKVTHLFDAMVSAPPPPVLVPIPEGAYTPGDAEGFIGPMPTGTTPGQLDALALAAQTATQVVQRVVHDEVRDALRELPQFVSVPQGWDKVFALGCLQQTDFCNG